MFNKLKASFKTKASSKDSEKPESLVEEVKLPEVNNASEHMPIQSLPLESFPVQSFKT